MFDVVEVLKSKNLKVTPQRVIICNIILQTDTHPTAEMIYRSMTEEHPHISLATVYKTLDALVKAGLAEEFNIGEGRSRYDGNMQPHHHMICKCCNRIYDIPFLASLEGVENELQNLTDFRTEVTKLYFYGLCKCCV